MIRSRSHDARRAGLDRRAFLRQVAVGAFAGAGILAARPARAKKKGDSLTVGPPHPQVC